MKNILHHKRIILIVSIISIFIIFMVFFILKKTNHNIKEERNDIVVEVIDSKAIPYSKNIKLVGKVDSSKHINLVAEFPGTINKIFVHSGNTVEKDQPILELDKLDYQNKLDQAKANLAKSKVELDSTKKLYEKGLSSLTTLKAKEAELSSAHAQLKRAEYELNKRSIKAPFNGRINNISVNKGSFITAGSVIGNMIGNGGFKVISYVSEKVVKDLELGLDVEIITLNGKKLFSKLNSIGNIVDPNTKTVPIEIFINETDINLLHGETCKVVIKTSSQPSHLIPTAFLLLDENGELIVKIIENNIVKVRKIKLVEETNEGAWLTGLDSANLIITLGNNYVSEGQKVNYIKNNSYSN